MYRAPEVIPAHPSLESSEASGEILKTAFVSARLLIIGLGFPLASLPQPVVDCARQYFLCSQDGGGAVSQFYSSAPRRPPKDELQPIPPGHSTGLVVRYRHSVFARIASA